MDERDLTVEQWKDLIYKEVVDYEISHGKSYTSFYISLKKYADLGFLR